LTRAGAAKKRAHQPAEPIPKSEQQIANLRMRLDKAIDRHDFINADRVIFPVFAE
jgi:hypothetical protein